MARKIGGLVESAFAASQPVQRHRYHTIGSEQHIAAAVAHQGAEGLGQRSAPVVLECVDD
jgi:hypothetical protein